jgi:hypothetical protein
MNRPRFCPRPYDDRGTSLVLALVFITVGSLVVMAVLGFADTNMLATIKLNDQADATAIAEGAANVAINNLRSGTFTGSGNCLGSGNALQLPMFHQHPDGTSDSARVTCDLDTAGTTGTPPWALLTLDTTPTGLVGPFGISVTNTVSGVGSLHVTGDVQSNSNISIQPKVFILPSGNLTSSGAILANQGCTSGSGLFIPTPTCNAPTVADPAYPPPTTLGPTQAVPACAAVMTFQPGRYTDFGNLTDRTSTHCQSGKGVLQFLPGIYYFVFGPPDVVEVPWTLTAGTVIGGTLSNGVTLGPSMSLSGNCVSPVPTGPGWVPPVQTEGVTFVFSGGSQMVVSGSAKVELCGRYAGLSAPLAVTAEATSGSLSGLCGATALPCAAVSTAASAAFVVQGTVYLRDRDLILGLNNTTTLSLRGGAVVHRVVANTSRAASSTPVIETPVRRTGVYLNVFVCTASPTCTAGGQMLLRTRVSITDPNAIPVAGRRQVTVLSWSLQV